jgi:hypothetical protein
VGGEQLYERMFFGVAQSTWKDLDVIIFVVPFDRA